MRQAKARSVEKERFWQEVLKEQAKSGLTVKAFCQQQGVSVPSFYAWRRKLMERNSDARGPQDDSPRMVPVTVIPPVPLASFTMMAWNSDRVSGVPMFSRRSFDQIAPSPLFGVPRANSWYSLAIV
jgi:hypothetical protein